jgi:ectoine hydroxylase-related dioxygenase (phytanoyl-CoA dioxygenase family)
MQQDAVSKSYHEAGFAHLRGVLDPGLVAGWRAPLVEAAHQLPNRARTQEIAAVFEPHRAAPSIAHILTAPALGRIAADGLGTQAVRLVAAAAYIKPPGAPATFWHQDLWFFPIADARMLTLWLPLAPIDAALAPMVYAAGSHRDGFTEASYDTPPEGKALLRAAPMALGDVAIHDGWTLHASDPNDGATAREAIGLSYIPADARFATRDALQASPARWQWLAPYLDDANYREGAPVDGPACPAIALS